MNQLTARQRLPGEPQITTLAGGGGGAGRSTIAAEVARYLQRRGRRVLLVDGDPDAIDQAHRFEQPVSREPGWKAGGRGDVYPEEWILPGDRTRPALLPLAVPCRRVLSSPRIDVTAFMARLRGLPYDHIVIDAAGRPDPNALDLFVLADVPVLVTPTEPAPLLRTTAFLRAAVLMALQRHGRDAVAPETVAAIAAELPLEWELPELRAACSKHGADRTLIAVLRDLQTYLLLSQTRETAERELAYPLVLVWLYQLGTRPRALGAIDHDERRWFHLRQDQLLPPLGSDQGTGVQLEEVARRLSEIGEVDREQPRPGPELVRAIDRIGVAEDCDATAARAAYRRLWEGLRRESSVSRRLVSVRLREQIVRELEDANREMQAWLAERSPRPNTPTEDVARPLERPPGEPIVVARNRLGLTQRELSLRTKIDVKHLDAIEQFRVELLPRAAYLRGYLREIATVLQVPAEPLMEQYLDAVAAARTQRILTGAQPRVGD